MSGLPKLRRAGDRRPLGHAGNWSTACTPSLRSTAGWFAIWRPTAADVVHRDRLGDSTHSMPIRPVPRPGLVLQSSQQHNPGWVIIWWGLGPRAATGRGARVISSSTSISYLPPGPRSHCHLLRLLLDYGCWRNQARNFAPRLLCSQELDRPARRLRQPGPRSLHRWITRPLSPASAPQSGTSSKPPTGGT